MIDEMQVTSFFMSVFNLHKMLTTKKLIVDKSEKRFDSGTKRNFRPLD